LLSDWGTPQRGDRAGWSISPGSVVMAFSRPAGQAALLFAIILGCKARQVSLSGLLDDIADIIPYTDEIAHYAAVGASEVILPGLTHPTPR
jgi:hypothetical protein